MNAFTINPCEWCTCLWLKALRIPTPHSPVKQTLQLLRLIILDSNPAAKLGHRKLLKAYRCTVCLYWKISESKRDQFLLYVCDMYILYINWIWYVNVRAWVPYAIADLGSSKYTTCHVDGRPALTTGKTCNDHFQASWSPRTPLTATVGCGCALASLRECWWEVDQKKNEGSRVSLGYLHTRTRLRIIFQITTSDCGSCMMHGGSTLRCRGSTSNVALPNLRRHVQHDMYPVD